MTALRTQHSHRPWQQDVTEELRLQDSTALERRRVGQSKRKRRAEFITLAPDHLLAINCDARALRSTPLLTPTLAGFSGYTWALRTALKLLLRAST